MRYLFKPFLIPLLLVFATTGFYAPNASAHGEKSQAAFMRMRTIYWFDLNWSKEELKVNDTMTISGKFHVFAGWPETVDKPEISFLNIGIPGPVFIRLGSWIGGQLVPRSVTLELGETYEFKVLLKARRPGDWHVHTLMNVKGGGPLIGPGKWVTITGSMSQFTNPITTLTGETIDLETYNLGNTYFWHAFWYVLGLAWIAYWARKPMYIPRIIAVDSGKADSLISPTDKKVAFVFGAGAIVIVALTMSSTNQQYPVTTPLQPGLLRGMKPIEMPAPTVAVKVDDATYRGPGRAMQMTLTVTNNDDSAIRLGEFMTAGVRFLDPAVTEDTTGYPDDLLAESGLTVSDNSPLAPGQTRTIQVTATDAAWEDYRLYDIIYDPDSRLAGLLFFFDADGNRSMVAVNAPLTRPFDLNTPSSRQPALVPPSKAPHVLFLSILIGGVLAAVLLGKNVSSLSKLLILIPPPLVILSAILVQFLHAKDITSQPLRSDAILGSAFVLLAVLYTEYVSTSLIKKAAEFEFSRLRTAYLIGGVILYLEVILLCFIAVFYVA